MSIDLEAIRAKVTEGKLIRGVEVKALIAEVERLNAENERLKLQRPIEVDENTVALACECSRLKQQLATVTAERDAAVEDMKLIADTYREVVGDDGICGLCEFDADHGLDGYANECPGFESNKCFKWRGERSGENG